LIVAENAFITCENLVKIYKVANLELVALQGLDLIVERGEMLGIIGPSGSGKSTLMNILGGLDRPSAGRVLVDGRDLRKIPDAALDGYRRTTVGFIWQQSSRNLVPYLTAEENVTLPMTFAGATPRVKGQRARELLDAVGLTHRRRHRLAQMSGGEQQRVAIAVALANMPKLLLGDEPTGEMDTATALAIYQLLRDLNQRYNLTTCIVSHDPTIARHVDRVVAIRDGKTATETIRQSFAPTQAADGSDETTQQEDIYHELVVLDSAGRLQVPKDYLEQFGIRGRAQLEITEDGILIRPAEIVQEAQATTTAGGETEAGVIRISLRKRLQAVGSTLGRWTRREPAPVANEREGNDGN
jgi:ABC-type lipoprotein export system ATPase subunit/bifunctional DNA-binding transcriptional regulator/antitoxin component of YhaV-PrlF toxin-antitoxin module